MLTMDGINATLYGPASKFLRNELARSYRFTTCLYNPAGTLCKAGQCQCYIKSRVKPVSSYHYAMTML